MDRERQRMRDQFLGLILVVNAAALLYRAIRMRARNLITVTACGAVAVLAAGFNGGSFLNARC